VRKTRRSKGYAADFFVINVTPTAEQPAELRTCEAAEALTAEQLETLRPLIYDGFPEFM
jgi:hypothetical protein